MSRKLTKEEFINREPDLLNGEYEFVGEYIKAKTQTLFKHVVCGYAWNVTPDNFHHGNRCPKCANLKKGVLKRLTKEEFINREPDLLSGEYQMFGDYVNAHTKTLFKHNICGYEWMSNPNNFHIGSRCPKCNGGIRISKDFFCKKEEDIRSGEYLMIGDYLNNHTKTLFKHRTCGYEWMVVPMSFHAGHRCPKCAGNAKLNKKLFCASEEVIQNGEYEVLGNYESALKKTLFKHNICGYEWMITPGNFHQGTRCPRCAGRERFTKESFCEKEEDICSGEYEFIGRYTDADTKSLFKHNICGYEWMITPGNFHQGRRCPKCAGNIKLTKEEFCEREEDIVSGEYKMIGMYVNTKTKTLFRHSACGYEWKITPNSFNQGNRCPKCKQSRGEKLITNILETLNIPFESQKRFDSCRHKLPLPFDFYVNDSFLVEFDGEQHFKPADFSGRGAEWADKSFKSGQLRDNIKTQWAKDNGIPLVRIPYTEFDDIEQIIKDNIEKYSIKKVG
ncbi:hypothetical protein [Pediococcus pentosaceus]|uniref:DUF559 domain-containing protein n=1 Tax=Pediococcus pentosaceus TaxID=1255 RepID=A0ABD7X9E2_PEDPE|nr:hypothetical protein [Pediococcus pentosaceus]WEA58251.1 hypothetical protein PWB86_09590 [Pediococcus pentosaceus]